MPLESPPELCFSATVSPADSDDALLPLISGTSDQVAPLEPQSQDQTYDYTKGFFDHAFFVEPKLDDGTEADRHSPLPLLW